MAWQPDTTGALNHIIAALKGHAAATPSGFVHPGVYAAEACMTPPAAETPDQQPQEPGNEPDEDEEHPDDGESPPVPADAPDEAEPAPAA